MDDHGETVEFVPLCWVSSKLSWWKRNAKFPTLRPNSRKLNSNIPEIWKKPKWPKKKQLICWKKKKINLTNSASRQKKTRNKILYFNFGSLNWKKIKTSKLQISGPNITKLKNKSDLTSAFFQHIPFCLILGSSSINYPHTKTSSTT